MASTFLGRPVYQVSAYAFADLLIDSGPPQRAAQLVAWCRGGPVRRVVLTHHHEDHVGGAAALQEELRLPILAPVGAVVAGKGYRLEIIPTPGHAFSHVCLFDQERRWLFSGDLYVHERVRYLRR